MGGILTHKYLHVELFVEPVTWIVPALVLLFGICTIIMALLGCTGMAIESKACSISYFCLQIAIIVAEITVGAYWLVRSSDVSSLVVTEQSFASYDIGNTMDWTILQTEMLCCGSQGPYDYETQNLTVPKECCITEPTLSTYRLLTTIFDQICRAAMVKKVGCKLILESSLDEERVVVAAFTFGGAVVKIMMLLLSFIIPFEEVTEEIGWSPIGSFEWNLNKGETEEGVNENGAL